MAFSMEVKMFALTNRRQGKGWGEIRRAIKERFGTERAPTVRSLQKWEKETDSGLLERSLKEEARKRSEEAREQTLAATAGELIPRLLKAKDAGEDIEYAGWSYLFTILEKSLGRDKFKKFIEQYLSEHPDKKNTPSESSATSENQTGN